MLPYTTFDYNSSIMQENSNLQWAYYKGGLQFSSDNLAILGVNVGGLV